MPKAFTFEPIDSCPQKDNCISKYLSALFIMQSSKKKVGIPNCKGCQYRPKESIREED